MRVRDEEEEAGEEDEEDDADEEDEEGRRSGRPRTGPRRQLIHPTLCGDIG